MFSNGESFLILFNIGQVLFPNFFVGIKLEFFPTDCCELPATVCHLVVFSTSRSEIYKTFYTYRWQTYSNYKDNAVKNLERYSGPVSLNLLTLEKTIVTFPAKNLYGL